MYFKTTAAGNGRGARGQQNGGRPSLTQAVNGYQRMSVNATGDPGAGTENGAADMNGGGADLGASAGEAYVVNGSVSSDVAAAQSNDWFGGRGGMYGGGGFGPGGMGGDQPGQSGQPGMMGGGRGGAGGPGGMAGGPGGFGGGRGGGGGFGGGGRGGGGGGRNGQGGRGGGRGGQNSFGNGRRNAQSHYNASLAFTLDNSALDAQNLSQVNSIAKPAYAKSSLTATVGGPLKIPHLIKTNNINFNLSYSLRRNRSASTNPYTLPTAAELGGDFSQVVNQQTQLPVVLYDPTTGQPFPATDPSKSSGTVIPVSRFSPQALGLLKYYPTASPVYSGRYNYQTALTSISNQDNINTRVGGTLNAKNQLNGSFSWQRGDGANPSVWLTGPGGANWFSGSHQNAERAEH